MVAGIKYFCPVTAADGATYSVDKIILQYRLRHGGAQRLLELLSRHLWLAFEHWESRRVGTYRNQFRFLLEGENSFWLGVGLNDYARGKPGENAKLEFNPNKVGNARTLLWLLHEIQGVNGLASEVRLKQWDFAVDWPLPRADMALRKDRRLYEEMAKSTANRTQYLGERNAPGRCKLYNKQLELGLPEPVTRLEITCAGQWNALDVVGVWPVVYNIHDVQTNTETAKLNDTDRFILATLLQEPDRIGELGRRKREKMAALLDGVGYTMSFDAEAFGAVAANAMAWCRAGAWGGDAAAQPSMRNATACENGADLTKAGM